MIMLNQIILVGRVQDLKQEQEKTIMTLKVKRSYKNVNGEYDNDIIPIILIKPINNTKLEYININDIVIVKGHIQTKEVDRFRGKQIKREIEISLIAEKITYY